MPIWWPQRHFKMWLVHFTVHSTNEHITPTGHGLSLATTTTAERERVVPHKPHCQNYRVRGPFRVYLFRTVALFPSYRGVRNLSGDETPERTWHRRILLPLLRLTPPTEGFPGDDLRKILHGGQTMAKWQRNIAESFNPLSRAHEGYRRQTDDRRQTDLR